MKRFVFPTIQIKKVRLKKTAPYLTKKPNQYFKIYSITNFLVLEAEPSETFIK